MANIDNWKPLYEYSNFFIVLAVSLLMIPVTFFCLFIFMMAQAADNEVAMAIIGIIGIILIIYVIYQIWDFNGSTAINRMSKYEIESVCKKNGVLLVRTASQKIGLFTRHGKAIINPQYRNIVFRKNYYLLEDDKGLWGAYNVSLSKLIVECSYSSIKVENSGNITVTQEGTRYTFSPYGTLIHKTNAAKDDMINNIMGRL